MRKKVSVHSLLKLIGNDFLTSLALETGTNYKSKKLQGEVVFKLLLMSLLDDKKISLRLMEKTFSNNLFKLYSGIEKGQTIRHSSLSERISVINSAYFERIHAHVYELSEQYFDTEQEPYNIRQFDSTSLSLSAKLLKKGMVNGLKNKKGEHGKKQIKFTVGLTNNLPSNIRFYNEQKHLAEDLTLREAILNANIKGTEVVVFDRGLKKRTTFQEFNQLDIFFVTRINPTKSIKVIEQNRLGNSIETDTLNIFSDERVYLYHQNKSLLKKPFRLIRSHSKQTREELLFLTNIEDLNADDVTEIYKRRWDIEVFFKFIKQHLHFKHLVNQSENGIKVMMYMTMIVGILLLLYKKLNNVKSYKIAKYEFTEELNMEIIREIVVICEGDPRKSDIFDTS
ncbi:IS4 family transposase [Flavivirga abyssicola]|uniref:IS4 family transposase n=1 Tax=Flavivirga abyssicola TaxID=3063533 RepID=UPI002ED45C6A|nr:IS4 family transposase [Flavivirga sp. MEBiC07777]WVK13356.1 IS4 family transposase [Flavivirga sp. MEBiC07777]